MRVLSIITDPQEVKKILLHPVKAGRSAPGQATVALPPGEHDLRLILD